jgi:hypothetical protein
MDKKSNFEKNSNSAARGSAGSMEVSKSTTETEVSDAQAMTSVLDKYSFHMDFYYQVEKKCMEIYPYLECGSVVSPKEIVGEIFWFSLNDLGKRAAILCLKDHASYYDSCLVDVTIEGSELSRFKVN